MTDTPRKEMRTSGLGVDVLGTGDGRGGYKSWCEKGYGRRGAELSI